VGGWSDEMRRPIPFLIGFVLMSQGAAAQPPGLTVFAAASLSQAMKAIDQAWVQRIILHYACHSRPVNARTPVR
jgi:ABC-type molybdate transport system substrate-binding protein